MCFVDLLLWVWSVKRLDSVHYIIRSWHLLFGWSSTWAHGVLENMWTFWSVVLLLFSPLSWLTCVRIQLLLEQSDWLLFRLDWYTSVWPSAAKLVVCDRTHWVRHSVFKVNVDHLRVFNNIEWWSQESTSCTWPLFIFRWVKAFRLHYDFST